MFSASAWAPRIFVDLCLGLMGAIRVLRLEREGGRRGVHTRGIKPARVDAVCVCVYRLSGFLIFLVRASHATKKNDSNVSLPDLFSCVEWFL